MRHWVKSIGTAPVSGTLSVRFFDPNGTLVELRQVDDLGIEPGRTHMYSWSYIKGSKLLSGEYRVELEYVYTYPTYAQTTVAEVYVARSQGTAIPTEPVGVQEQLSPLTGDFDGNGNDDIATFSTGEGLWTVLESDGSDFDPVQWADFSTASGWLHRMAGDYNGDGKDDIAQFHPSNGTWWISRSSGGAFSTGRWADFTTSSGWQSHMTGDYNGDGKDDIAQFHPSNGTWWISRSTGSSFVTELWADFSTASGWQARMTGDYTGDGRDDIAQYHPTNGTWWISASTDSGFATVNWSD